MNISHETNSSSFYGNSSSLEKELKSEKEHRQALQRELQHEKDTSCLLRTELQQVEGLKKVRWALLGRESLWQSPEAPGTLLAGSSPRTLCVAAPGRGEAVRGLLF